MKRSRGFQVLGGGLIVGVCALGAAWLGRNAIVEAMLERDLSNLTGAGADIQAVDVQPFAGSLTIEGLRLNNPEGFSQPHLLTLEQLELQLEPNTLFQDTVQMQSLMVDGGGSECGTQYY